MCGRFVVKATWEELEDWYNIIKPDLPPFPESYNVSPTQPVPIIGCFSEKDKYQCELTFARWGLIPFWWKKPLNELPRSINARAEGIETKPFYRAAYKHRRCLIPVRGFYEWKGTKSPKQPYYISSTHGHLLSFAGVYEHWIESASGSEVISVSIITTRANEFMKSIHSRMPVMIPQHRFDDWFHHSFEDFLSLRVSEDLQAWPVSTRMNSAAYNKPDCIEPLEDNRLL